MLLLLVMLLPSEMLGDQSRVEALIDTQCACQSPSADGQVETFHGGVQMCAPPRCGARRVRHRYSAWPGDHPEEISAGGTPATSDACADRPRHRSRLCAHGTVDAVLPHR